VEPHPAAADGAERLVPERRSYPFPSRPSRGADGELRSQFTHLDSGIIGRSDVAVRRRGTSHASFYGRGVESGAIALKRTLERSSWLARPVPRLSSGRLVLTIPIIILQTKAGS